jgi:hypothetical protein
MHCKRELPAPPHRIQNLLNCVQMPINLDIHRKEIDLDSRSNVRERWVFTCFFSGSLIIRGTTFRKILPASSWWCSAVRACTTAGRCSRASCGAAAPACPSPRLYPRHLSARPRAVPRSAGRLGTAAAAAAWIKSCSNEGNVLEQLQHQIIPQGHFNLSQLARREPANSRSNDFSLVQCGDLVGQG